MGTLDPTSFISGLNCCFNSNDEVESRRCISILYFSVFNFWMEKCNVKPGQDKDYQDMEKSFKTLQTTKGSKVPIVEVSNLNQFRVFADHYHGNNTTMLRNNSSKFILFDKNLQMEMKKNAETVIAFLNSINRMP